MERGDLRDGPIILTRRNEDTYAMERQSLRYGTKLISMPHSLLFTLWNDSPADSSLSFQISGGMWLNKSKEVHAPGTR